MTRLWIGLPLPLHNGRVTVYSKNKDSSVKGHRVPITGFRMDNGRAGNTPQSLWPGADFQQALGLPLFLYLHLFIVLEEPSRSPGPMHPTFSASQYPHLNSLTLMCLAWASKSNGLGSSPAPPSPTEWQEPYHFTSSSGCKMGQGIPPASQAVERIKWQNVFKVLISTVPVS